MTPSVDQRMASMIRALSEIILPELADTKGLAKEQAGLVLGHLVVLRQQHDHAHRYERLELLATHNLAGEMLNLGDGGPRTQATLGALREVWNQPLEDLFPQGVRDRLEALNAALEALISASGEDGTSAFVASSGDLILKFGSAQAMRDRTFFQGMQFEAADANLPTIEAMMHEFGRTVMG